MQERKVQVQMVAGAGLPSRLAPLSYVGRLSRPRHDPAPLRGYTGSNLAHFQTKMGPTRGPILRLVAGVRIGHYFRKRVA